MDRKRNKEERKGKAATEIELIRRAVDEFIENHSEMFGGLTIETATKTSQQKHKSMEKTGGSTKSYKTET